jgi:hypothetical protein
MGKAVKLVKPASHDLVVIRFHDADAVLGKAGIVLSIFEVN